VVHPLSIRRDRLHALIETETTRFRANHPQSERLFERARKHLLGGVPMHWMMRWAGPFPVFVAEAWGASFVDVDGHEYVDLCLGDTGAMTGHAPQATLEAIHERAPKGITTMLPSEDAIRAAELLSDRFGLPYWQLAMTATDANRFAIRLARHVTKRPKILVFNWCYHGTVDETFATLEDGTVQPRLGHIGPPVDPGLTTKVIEWNDVPALQAALEPRDVACVLAEPVMTNIGIIHPDPGFHDALRDFTRRTGTLLILDETHTICAGPGGYTRAHDLEPDMLTVGKPIAGGFPAAAYGFSSELGERVAKSIERDLADTGGIGGTLTGNPLAAALIRATLEQVLTAQAYERMIPMATRFTRGVQGVIDEFKLPWVINQLGSRAEYWFCQHLPKNGGQAAAAIDAELDRFMHLWALNRGVLMTPFHNMALIGPATTDADVDRHTVVFRDAVQALLE
jgi:glutamate-1-semialdehyde 2,1-aminomutase